MCKRFICAAIIAAFCLNSNYSLANSVPDSVECLEHIEGINLLAPSALRRLDLIVDAFVAEDVIGASVGKKSFVVSEAKRLQVGGGGYNKKILKFTEGANNSVDKGLASRELKKLEAEIKTGVDGVFVEAVHSKYLMCALKSVAASESSRFASKVNFFINDAAGKFNASDIGYFKVTVNSCSVKARVGTGNQFVEPKVWDGSVFLVIDASFKNMDTEGRLPVVGDALIESAGKEYVYDHSETILLEGYGVFLDSVNPLVTMRTKIVYRIPSEIKGEIYWRPGRNSSNIKLWCGYKD